MKFVIGNLLEADTQALVNTVNTVGVMGKGIALQFKEQFPMNFKVYAAACKNGEVKIGKMLVVKENTMKGEKLIINFPTKTEWFKKSQYNYIEEGLKDLVNVIREYNIKSIAIPPLGTGNGGLKWNNVKTLMEQYLGYLKDIDIILYEPNDAVKEILQKESERKVELTPSRAMFLHALFKYERLGEVASLFAANKLAYFLQRSGEPLRLEFVPFTYGPYAQAVEKVLYAMNGKYLTGFEQMKAKPFEPLQLNYGKLGEVEEFVKKKLNATQISRLDSLFNIIDGFESSLSLEILASIDFLLNKNRQLSNNELLRQIQEWNSRKKELISEEHIAIAVKHLKEYGSSLNFA
jgi:O-acetyl-ADP-ribose deacetylase (regulator of RNase III)